MLVVVIDTNILASGVLRRASPPADVINAWYRRELDVVVSQHLIDELQRTLAKPYFHRHSTAQRIEQMLFAVTTLATRVNPQPLPRPVATHPEDDLILATAIAGRAQFLVTGDRQLLALGHYENVRIVTASEFLAVLASGEAEPTTPQQ